VVVDEAQELAPLELALLADALAPGGSLVVAGDASQQVDSTSSFERWSQTLRDLGAPSFATVSLETSYRCPPAVTALAREALVCERPLLDREDLGSERVVRWRDSSEAHMLARVGSALRALRREDRSATVAIVARDEDSAERWTELLAPTLDLRFARDGDFSDGCATHACTVREVKGLEFDYVLVLDATSARYPLTPEGRRSLYVAVTRTTHALALGAV
jgi:DNA helicase IV